MTEVSNPVDLPASAVESHASSQSQSANPLARKLKKVLDMRLEGDKETLEALKALSGYFSENSLRTRRNLRSDIEKRSLAINDGFLKAFQSVQLDLDSVYNDVKAMNDCCQDMTDRLKAAKSQTRDLITQTTQLQNESNVLQMKMTVANEFLSKFTLTPEELRSLKGNRDAPGLNKEFFIALARVKQIHDECKILLRTNHQTAGLEIMETMALHQEAAYERLYRWTQGECRLISSESPDINMTLCEAVAALQDRTVLFKYSLDEFCAARRTAIVRSFIDALTRGGPGGTPKPIELHSHDPLRYVGDILAWLHQACASEQEHLSSLLRLCDKQVSAESVKQCLSPITEGLCRPFKVRVEQVLVSELTAVSLYKLQNLVHFYTSTISQMLVSGSSMLVTLTEIGTLSSTLFYNSLNCHTNKLLEQVEYPSDMELSPVSNLKTTLHLLQDILSCRDSTVVSPEIRQKDFSKILKTLVEPLVQMCTVSASNLSTINMAVYMINCLYEQHVTLTLFEYTEPHLELLQAQIEAHIDTLVSEDASYILNKIGLATVYNLLQKTQENAANIPELSAQTIKTAMSKFDKLMVTPDIYHLPQIALLHAPKYRDMIKQKSCGVLLSVYRIIYDSVMLPSNQYTNSTSILPWTPDQVASLLHV